MTNRHDILEQISKDEALARELRQGKLAAFEKLNLNFDQLYTSVEEELESVAFACGVTGCPCGLTFSHSETTADIPEEPDNL